MTGAMNMGMRTTEIRMLRPRLASWMASAIVTPRNSSSPTVAMKYTMERTQLAHTAPSPNSRDQLSSAAQLNEIPPMSFTCERLIAMM